jgi:hypothetical protein
MRGETIAEICSLGVALATAITAHSGSSGPLWRCNLRHIAFA